MPSQSDQGHLASTPRSGVKSNLRLFAAALCSLFALSACSGEGEAPPQINSVGSSSGYEGEPGLRTGPCKGDEEAACGKSQKLESGVVWCMRGTQYCEDGLWGDCVDGTVTKELDPASWAARGDLERLPASLSQPEECIDNPCDPSCMYFAEDPDDIGGGEGGPVPNPVFGGEGSTCLHPLCEVGPGLDAICDPCVADVCDVDPTCCSDAWNQDCVDLVYIECGGQRPPLGLCDFGLFSDTTVDLSNRSATSSAIGAYGDISVSTDSEFSGVISTGNVSYANLNGKDIDAPLGIYADGSISFSASNSEIRGMVGAGTFVDIGSGVKITDDVSAGEDITGQLTAEIWGDAFANTGIDATVDVDPGTAYPNYGFAPVPVSLPPQDAGTSIPELETQCHGTTDFIEDGQTGTVSGPGVYGDVSVINGGAIRLVGQGVYYFTSFDVTGQIILDADGEELAEGFDIRVCNGVKLGNDTLVIGHGGIEVDSVGIVLDPLWMTLYTNGTQDVQLGVDVFFTGILMAPYAHISKADMNSSPSAIEILSGDRSAPVNGALWGHSLTLGTDAATMAIDKSSCEAKAIPGTLPSGECPVVANGASSPIVEPCQSGLDCQLNHRCESVTTGETCVHSKCLKGAPLANSCDPCVKSICEVDPACCGVEWSEGCVDKVATVCDATCGEVTCEHSACEEGAALDASCGSCVSSVCDELPGCCAGDWSAACVDKMYELCGEMSLAEPPAGVSICDYAAFSPGALTLGGTSAQPLSIQGGHVFSGNLGTFVVQHAEVDGSIYSSGPFDVDESATGQLLTSSTNDSYVDQSTVNGEVITSIVFAGGDSQPVLTRPSPSFTCPAGDGSPTGGAIAPGDYASVLVADGATLSLSEGTYTFNSLTVGEGVSGILELEPGVRIQINVCGDVSFLSGAQMVGPSASGPMMVGIHSRGNLRALGDNQLYGFFNSDGRIDLLDGARLRGAAVSAGGMDIKDGAGVDFTGLSADCKDYFDPQETRPSAPDRLCAYGAFGSDELVSESGTGLFGGSWGGGIVQLGDDSVVEGNIISTGDIQLGSGGLIRGNAIASGTVDGVAAELQGQLISGSSDVPTPEFASIPFVCPTSGPDHSTGGSLHLSPDVSYGNINLWNGGSLTLPSAGKYYVDDLRFNANNTLHLPTSGVVEIYACGEVEIDDQFSQTGVGAADASRLRIFSASAARGNIGGAIWIKNSAVARSVSGLFVAPFGAVRVGHNTELNGVAWGDRASLGENATVDASGLLGAACESWGVDGSVACPEVIVPRSEDEAGSCELNESGYQDSLCEGFDLALGPGCDAELPVCNHGSSAFSGVLSVGYWSAEKQQMSLETPTISPDGLCVADVTIAPGDCETIDCAVPDSLHSLRVDPEGLLAECNGGSLDNWSVHDGRTCAGPGSFQSVNYEYEAVCPEDTSARWGLLTWNTQTPGDSLINFRARVANDQASLSGEAFALVGVAEAGPVDRQICPLAGVSGCPVDLTSTLSLGENQGQFLELKMELDPQNSAPILQDWKVTYSCVFDQ